MQIPGSGNTIARTASLTLRRASVPLRPPRPRCRKGLPDIEVFVIQALEVDVAEGLEPLEWMLPLRCPRTSAGALDLVRPPLDNRIVALRAQERLPR